MPNESTLLHLLSLDCTKSSTSTQLEIIPLLLGYNRLFQAVGKPHGEDNVPRDLQLSTSCICPARRLRPTSVTGAFQRPVTAPSEDLACEHPPECTLNVLRILQRNYHETDVMIPHYTLVVCPTVILVRLEQCKGGSQI